MSIIHYSYIQSSNGAQRRHSKNAECSETDLNATFASSNSLNNDILLLVMNTDGDHIGNCNRQWSTLSRHVCEQITKPVRGSVRNVSLQHKCIRLLGQAAYKLTAVKTFSESVNRLTPDTRRAMSQADVHHISLRSDAKATRRELPAAATLLPY